MDPRSMEERRQLGEFRLEQWHEDIDINPAKVYNATIAVKRFHAVVICGDTLVLLIKIYTPINANIVIAVFRMKSNLACKIL